MKILSLYRFIAFSFNDSVYIGLLFKVKKTLIILMDDVKHKQLELLANAFVSPFIKNGKSHERIIIVSDDFEARIYVAGAMLDRLEVADKDIAIVEANKLPRDFVRGRDYAIGLDWYLQDRTRKACDFFY